MQLYAENFADIISAIQLGTHPAQQAQLKPVIDSLTDSKYVQQHLLPELKQHLESTRDYTILKAFLSRYILDKFNVFVDFTPPPVKPS